jgi:hypothetical protein
MSTEHRNGALPRQMVKRDTFPSFTPAKAGVQVDLEPTQEDQNGFRLAPE